jgi:hypothetical protein
VDLARRVENNHKIVTILLMLMLEDKAGPWMSNVDMNTPANAAD